MKIIFSTLRHHLRSRRLFSGGALTFVCVLFALPLSCGGGTSPRPRPAAHGAESAAQPAAQQAAESPEDAWSALEPYFNQFMDQSITEFKDPFKLQIVKHVGKKDLLEQLTALRPSDGGDSSAARGPEIPKGPLQRYGVAAYRPIIIMTGVSEPKAVLESPKGQTFVVMRDTYVGTEGGFVEDLTQYHVVFRVPGLDEPVVKSLKPELMERLKGEMGNKLQLQADF